MKREGEKKTSKKDFNLSRQSSLLFFCVCVAPLIMHATSISISDTNSIGKKVYYWIKLPLSALERLRTSPTFNFKFHFSIEQNFALRVRFVVRRASM